jgi:hypothetical protein
MKRLVMLGMLGVAGVVGACGSGAQGPTGQQGPAGMNGVDGTNGEAGPPGSGTALTPSVSGITPPQSFLARTTELTISGYGTSWSSSTTVDFGGTDIAVNKITVASPTALVVSISTAKSAAIGPRDVTVKDGVNTETYKGAFQVLSPLAVTFQGNVAQGGWVYANVKVLDLSTPLDTTTDPTSGAFTNLAVTAPAGVNSLVTAAADYTATIEMQIDVDAMTGTGDLDLVSGPAGASTNVDSPAPKAFNVAAVTPTVLVAGTGVSGTTAATFDTSVYSFTPASASQTILDFGISTTSSTAAPGLYLLTDAKWADYATGAIAQTGGGTFSFVTTQATPLYAITWDQSGATGPFTLAGVVSTAAASTAAATATDGTTTTAIPATTFPFVLTGGDLSNNNGGGDWVKVKMPAGKTSLRVQSSGDTQTDAVVAVTTDGSTVAGTTTDNTETGTIVDATFTGLTAGATYYVTFTEGISGQLNGSPTDYTGILRALP